MTDVVVTWTPIPFHLDQVAVARFARFVDISGGRDACWPWLGSRLPSGYGRFGYQGRVVMASRFSLELALGRPLRPGMLACHTCDNPPCVNSLHLYEGTFRDNARDAEARGRIDVGRRAANIRAIHRNPDAQARGARISTSKLTDEAVRELRRLAAGGMSYRALSRAYGVDDSTISRIVRRRTWGHVA